MNDNEKRLQGNPVNETFTANPGELDSTTESTSGLSHRPNYLLPRDFTLFYLRPPEPKVTGSILSGILAENLT